MMDFCNSSRFGPETFWLGRKERVAHGPSGAMGSGRALVPSGASTLHQTGVRSEPRVPAVCAPHLHQPHIDWLSRGWTVVETEARGVPARRS